MPLSALSGALDSAAVGYVTGAIGVPATRALARVVASLLRATLAQRRGTLPEWLVRFARALLATLRRVGFDGDEAFRLGASGDKDGDEAGRAARPAAGGLSSGGSGGEDGVRSSRRKGKSAASQWVGSVGGVLGVLVLWSRYKHWSGLRKVVFWVAVVAGVRGRLSQVPAAAGMLGLMDSLSGVGKSPATRSQVRWTRNVAGLVGKPASRTLSEHLGLMSFESPRTVFGQQDDDGTPVSTGCTRELRTVPASDGTNLKLRIFKPILEKRVDMTSEKTVILRSRAAAIAAARAARRAAFGAGDAAVANAKQLAAVGLKALGLASSTSALQAQRSASTTSLKGEADSRASTVEFSDDFVVLPDVDLSASGIMNEGAVPILVYYHGGGFTLCGGDFHDDLMEQIARRARCIVVAVDYRLSPEHKFPVPFTDACDGLMWVLRNAGALGGRSDRVLVGGDSAGGNLAAAVCLRARDEQWSPPILGQALVYPVVCHAFDSATMKAYGSGYLLSERVMRWFTENYLRTPDDASHPYAAPLASPDLSGLPPAFVALAEYDILRADGRAYAAALAAAGVSTSISHYAGTAHGFANLRMFFYGQQDRLVTEVAQFVRFWTEVASEVEAASMLEAAAELSGDLPVPPARGTLIAPAADGRAPASSHESAASRPARRDVPRSAGQFVVKDDHF